MSSSRETTGRAAPAWALSPFAGRLWLAAALFVALLVWQQVAGSPLKRHTALKPTLGAAGDLPGILQFHIRSERDGEPWNTAFMRVFDGRAPLYRCISLEQLQGSAAPGFHVHGRKVYVRPSWPPGESGAKQEIRAELPWEAPEPLFWLVIVSFCGVTALLFHWKNPTVAAALSALWRSSAKSPRTLWFGGCLAGAILMGAMVYRAGGFSFPIIGDDTPEYLKPAVQFAFGGPLYATADRPFGCPLVFGLALRAVHDLRSIIVLQEGATLFAAASLCVILFLAGRRLFEEPGLQLLAMGAGLGALTVFAFNENIVEREWAILPEGWAAFYLGAALLLIWAMASAKLGRIALLVCYTALCVTTWMMCFTKPNWGLAVALTPFPLAVAGALRVGSWRGARAWGLAGLGIFAMVSAAALGWQLHLTPPGRSAGLEVRSKVLFCWHAPMIRREIARRLESKTDETHRAALVDLARIIDEEFARTKEMGPGVYEKLGYDADWILYVGLKKADAFGALPRDERIGLCRNLFFAALRQEPMTYFRKVAVQFSNYFVRPYGTHANFETGPAFIRREQLFEALERSEQFMAPAPGWLPAEIGDRFATTLAAARPELEGPWPPAFRYGLSLRVSIIVEYLRRAFIATLFGSMSIFVAAALIPWWRRVVDWRRLAPVLCVAGWSVGAASLSALTSSIAQALEIQRYIDLYMPLTLLSELLWPLIGVSLILTAARAILLDPVRLQAGASVGSALAEAEV